jgi:subtilisin family serine protease/subtilisin-like proprotein convertase family protein
MRCIGRDELVFARRSVASNAPQRQHAFLRMEMHSDGMVSGVPIMIFRNSRRKREVAARNGRSPRRLHLELLEQRALMDAGLGPQLLLALRSGDYRTVRLDSAAEVSSALAAYQADPDVMSAEIDQQVSISLLPNDPQMGSLWGLRNTGQSGGTVDADIDADQAWDSRTGSLRTAVGVIDSGIDYTHPDLYRNIWLNQDEIPAGLGLVDTDADGIFTFWDLAAAANAGKVNDANADGRIDGRDVLSDARWANGSDNDGNGKVDDLIGWDFVNNDNNPFDDNGHGTHVSGTIGAMGNNGVGVAGVNWKVSLVGLKFLDASGSGFTSAAVSALNYAVSEGIKISNNSWGGGGFSSAMATAISNARAAGHVFVAAAGNAAGNNDTTANYPSNYNSDNVVAVASTDRFDQLSSFSNFGATTVDLAAPGSSILSTTPNNTYSTFSGTSMATPHVAGAVALVWSAEPGMTYGQVISRIKSSVDVLSSLTGRVATGGRLNVAKALGAAAPDTSGPRVVSAVPNGVTSVSRVRVTFSEAITAATFTAADVANFSGPQGAIAVGGIQVVAGTNNTQFDVTFASQTTVGAYQFDLGPNISDTAGNPMDQNGNGVKGEAADAYHVAFNVSTTSTTTFTNSTPMPIRDFTLTASAITIAQDLTVTDLNVRLNISHTFDGDLSIYLVGPDGTRVNLVTNRGGSGNHFTNTVLDDEATRLVRNGTPPFTGSYRPEQPLSAFDGKNARGTWTLFVNDGFAADIGTLNSWSLVVTGAAGAAAAASPAGSANRLSAGAVASLPPQLVWFAERGNDRSTIRSEEAFAAWIQRPEAAHRTAKIRQAAAAATSSHVLAPASIDMAYASF